MKTFKDLKLAGDSALGAFMHFDNKWGLWVRPDEKRGRYSVFLRRRLSNGMWIFVGWSDYWKARAPLPRAAVNLSKTEVTVYMLQIQML
jgi:hypothetical protein